MGDRDQDSDLTMDAIKKLVSYFPNVDLVYEKKDHPDASAAYAHMSKTFRELDPMLHPH